MTVGQAIDRLPPDALRRVAAARRWAYGRSRRGGGSRCLAAHAVGPEAFLVYTSWAELLGVRYDAGVDVTRRFDRLARRVGIVRAGPLCSARARRRLVERAVDRDVASAIVVDAVLRAGRSERVARDVAEIANLTLDEIESLGG